jgi:hypothetical protein
MAIKIKVKHIFYLYYILRNKKFIIYIMDTGTKVFVGIVAMVIVIGLILLMLWAAGVFNRGATGPTGTAPGEAPRTPAAPAAGTSSPGTGSTPGTPAGSTGPPAPPPPPPPANDILLAGNCLEPDKTLVSSNRQFTFYNQFDGNLVIYGGGRALWASNTNVEGRLCMQNDGNLTLTSPSGVVVWASGSSGRESAPYNLLMQNDGNLVIYGNGKPIWATGIPPSGVVAGTNTPANEWNTAKWSCIQFGDNFVPIRTNKNNDVECLSLNAKDCLTALGKTECDQMASNHAGGVKPIACTDSASGFTSQTTGHFCNNSALPRDANLEPLEWDKVKWSCDTATGIVIRRNSEGTLECLSLDKAKCLKAKGASECSAMATTPIGGIQPLACGAAHAAQWNGDRGYESAGHWCNANKDTLPRQI